MKKISTLLFFISIVIFKILANPASIRPIQVIQKDESKINLFLKGDEWFHYYVTEDNIPVIQGEDLSYYYIHVKNSCLSNSEILAHNADERNIEEKTFIKNCISEVEIAINERCDNINIEKRVAHEKSMSSLKIAKWVNASNFIGSKKGLVILVNFADTEMIGENPNQQFDRLFNEPGYNDNNHIGSVHDYFYDQSYGQFDLEFDIVGPVTVSRELSYYGKNDIMTGNDKYPREMVAEACRLIDPYVDFKDYDWDGDGEVEQVFVIYAGYGESNGASSSTIWPHKSVLNGIDENNFCLDGVRIYTYACSCELAGYNGTTMTGIGTPCHEFSHCLGLPDFYDVNYNGGFGMSYWDVMCNGSHNGPELNGEIPSGFTAYERWFAGWLDFTELTEMERIENLPSLQNQPVAYKIVNDNYPDEYFILENRQNDRWFSYVGDNCAISGLLVYHVDYSPVAWSMNIVNTNRTHQRMSVVPADNNYGTYIDNGSSKRYIVSADELYGDLFPGSNDITEFTNSSHPNAGGKLFNNNTDGTYYLNKPVTNIKNLNGNISFDFMGGIYVPTPIIENVFDIENDGFKISWHTDSPVDSYSIEVTEIRKKSPIETKITEENFDSFISTQTEQDGKIDLSIYINSYMNSYGWVSENIFTSPYGMKIGGDNLVGYMTSPDLNLSSGNLTLQISSMSIADNPTPMELSLINEMGQVYDITEIDGTSSMSEQLVNFVDLLPGYYNLKITSKTPFYINKLRIYDEYYTLDEIKQSSILASILNPVEIITNNDVTEDFYVFDNLKGNKYKFRIKACLDEAFSEWSEYVTVELIDSNYLESIFENTEKAVKIYDISGKRITKPQSPGIYIFKHKDKSLKIVI